MDRPLPWLKYIDADDLDDDRVDFDGLNVESPTGEHLGDVEGFVVDTDDARPYYVVVDAGGWFKSKAFLLPIGNASLDTEREVIVTELSRDRIEKFPGFDKERFDTLSEDDLRQFNDQTSQAISGGLQTYSTEHFSAAWARPEFRYPDWWLPEPTRMGSQEIIAGGDYGDPTMADLTRPVDRRDEVQTSAGGADPVAARSEIDPSPHQDGRAQPGDVLGLETGGETSHIGDTAEDENKRRRDAQEEAAKLRK